MAKLTVLKHGREATMKVPKKLSLEAFARRRKIGEALRALREKRDLSITEAAAAAGTQYSTWQRWEKGTSAIPLELVAEICRALGQDLVRPIKPYLSAA